MFKKTVSALTVSAALAITSMSAQAYTIDENGNLSITIGAGSTKGGYYKQVAKPIADEFANNPALTVTIVNLKGSGEIQNQMSKALVDMSASQTDAGLLFEGDNRPNRDEDLYSEPLQIFCHSRSGIESIGDMIKTANKRTVNVWIDNLSAGQHITMRTMMDLSPDFKDAQISLKTGKSFRIAGKLKSGKLDCAAFVTGFDKDHKTIAPMLANTFGEMRLISADPETLDGLEKLKDTYGKQIYRAKTVDEDIYSNLKTGLYGDPKVLHVTASLYYSQQFMDMLEGADFEKLSPQAQSAVDELFNTVIPSVVQNAQNTYGLIK